MDSEIILNIRNKYLQVQDLLNNKAKADPDDEPYKSKYMALDLLIPVKDTLATYLEFHPDNEGYKDILGMLLFLVANVYFDVEEVQNAHDNVMKVLELLSIKKVDPRRIFCIISSYNLLGLIWSQRKDNAKARDCLLEAEGLYKTYKEQFKESPFDFDMLLEVETSSSNRLFEKLHTQTLFYIAQCFHHLGEFERAGRYCHTTLNRELMSNDFDEIDWALNAATFSQYLIERNAFKEARHHLAAASKILDLYKDKLNKMDSEDDVHKAKKETLKHRSADVAHCWAKYGIFLLTLSKERLMTSDDAAVVPPPESLRGLKFTGFDACDYEKTYPCEFLLTYEDAKPVFIRSQDWLNIAKSYYTMEDHASDHIKIIQDSSQLYQLLIFYQSDENIQCRMHKRRLDMLSKLVNELNATYYLNCCQELWFELGEICVAMADTKASQMVNSDSSSQHATDKVNQILRKGINYFEQYIKSHKTDSNGRYAEEDERSVLLAHMYLGRMFAKTLSRNKSVIIDVHMKSLDYYKAIIDYCTKHEEAKISMLAEIGMCKEMAELIPIKLRKLTGNV